MPAFLLPSCMCPPVPVSPEDPALDEPVVRFKSLLTPLAPAFPVVPMLTSPLELPELVPLGMEMLPPVPACEAPPEMLTQPLKFDPALLQRPRDLALFQLEVLEENVPRSILVPVTFISATRALELLRTPQPPIN